MRKDILLFALLFTIADGIVSQERGTDETISDAIAKQGQAFIKDKNLSSVSIGIYKDGKIYTRHFGELERGKENSPNDKTLYEIGSVTKPMTGYLVAKAVFDGKLKLDDDVRNYLKGDFNNLSFNGEPITVQHLLTHTGGLPMYLPLEMEPLFEDLQKDVPQRFFELEANYNKPQFFKDLALVEITSQPGTNYAYSNAGADLMGHILEVVYDKDIDAIFSDILFGPAQMENTGIHLDQTKASQVTKGYWMNNTEPSPNQLNTLWGTGGGAKSTIIDLLKFVALQLDDANPISQASQEVLFEGEKLLKVGYFWRVWNDKYGRSFNHHGGTPGTQNWLFVFPKYDMGISVITNQSGPKTPRKLSATVKKILKSIIKA